MTKASTLEQDRAALHGLLQAALMLELSTIPPYATALYSMQDQGQYNRSAPEVVNAEPAEVIRQVMVEEMLHIVLVANVLNAIGFAPVMNDPAQVPRYPRRMLGDRGPLMRLRRFDPDQIRAFREIERGLEDAERARGGDYGTIGGFYLYLLQRLQDAVAAWGEAQIFTGAPGRQIGPADYYGAGGEVISVQDLASAAQAIAKIMDEGEGAALGHRAGDGDRIPAPPGEAREDVAHFFKFNEILHSRYYEPDNHPDTAPTGGDMVVEWSAVWPMRDDPKEADYEGLPDILAMSRAFNASYRALLDGLNAGFNGEKGRLAELVPVMYRLREGAQRLMRVPLPGTGQTAGPSWEIAG